MLRSVVRAITRAHVTGGGAPAGIQAMLLDIEGTTTPLAFVADVLFPYARSHLRGYLARHAASPELQALVDRLRDEHTADRGAGEAVPPWVEAPPAARLDALVHYAGWLMDRDRKSTALKALQGLIWEEGYRRGELIGDVYADVPGALERWHAGNLQTGIFSSGSVLAQQLLFRHSSAGDLSRFIPWHFDTTTGAKAESDSYRRIAKAMAMEAGAVLFVSDVTAELDAARAAGIDTRLCVRPGNRAAPPGHGHGVIRTFDELP